MSASNRTRSGAYAGAILNRLLGRKAANHATDPHRRSEPHDKFDVSSEELMPEKSMSQVVTEAIKAFRHSVPDCVAAGIIDMSTGMLLSVETTDNHPQEVLDLLAAATFDIFQGRNVVMIENIFNHRRGVTATGHYFQEILVNSQHLAHLFMRSAVNVDIVAAVICRRTVNVGMMFAQSRLVMKEVDAAMA